MKVIRRRIRLLLVCILGCFVLTGFYFCYSIYFYGGRWVANAHNPRISNQKRIVTTGPVSDRMGSWRAWTDENGERNYSGSRDVRMAVSQVVGDSEGYVSTGVDTFHAQHLLGFNARLMERLKDAVTGTPLRGDDVVLTISESLSRYISREFPAGKKGAVVVMNYRTGEILSMVSMPQFDPLNVTEAMVDNEGGPLMNRAIQGLYPPGSTFKIVTLASAYENLPDLEDFAFDCTGYYPVGSYSVTENSAHGVQNLSTAFANSCNTAFAAISQDLGYTMLGDTAERLGFNQNYLFSDLIVYNSSYPIDNASAEDLAWSSIGQGRVLVTPLHMAMIVSAVACNGVMKEPRLISRIITPGGHNRALPQKSSWTALSPEVARRVERDMINAVKNGTGRRAALGSGYVVAGKTGTAEPSDDKSVGSHAWFVGYVTNDRAPYAVSIVVENAGSGGAVAAPLARKIFEKAINMGL